MWHARRQSSLHIQIGVSKARLSQATDVYFSIKTARAARIRSTFHAAACIRSERQPTCLEAFRMSWVGTGAHTRAASCLVLLFKNASTAAQHSSTSECRRVHVLSVLLTAAATHRIKSLANASEPHCTVSGACQNSPSISSQPHSSITLLHLWALMGCMSYSRCIAALITLRLARFTLLEHACSATCDST